MTPSATGLELVVQPTAHSSALLYPEEAALFDMIMTNRSTSPVRVLRLTGNMETPQIIASDGDGKTIGAYTYFMMRKRAGNDPEHKEPGPPSFLELGPGVRTTVPLNLWHFAGPFAPGKYSLHLEHQVSEGGPSLTSNAAPFEIVPAAINGFASGYADIDQSGSVVAWLASGAPGQPSRLLVRLSSRKGYKILQTGANSFGEFPAGSSVAVAQAGTTAPSSGQGWVLLTNGHEGTMFRHNMANLTRTIGPVSFAADHLTAVPGFPDFGQSTVALATGAANGRPVLAGFAAKDAQASAPWMLPLSAMPVMAAACPQGDQRIHIVYAADDGQESKLFRLVIDPTGKVLEPEKAIRSSRNLPRALRVHANRELVPAFLYLESDRNDPATVTYVRIPVQGSLKAYDPHRLSGWPTILNAHGELAPAAATAFDIGQDPNSSLRLAVTDTFGNLYGGALDRGLSVLRPAKGDPVSHPHVVCLKNASNIAAFTSAGYLYFSPR